jgi:hypothetical protein
VVYPFWVTLGRLTVRVTLLCHYNKTVYRQKSISSRSTHYSNTHQICIRCLTDYRSIPQIRVPKFPTSYSKSLVTSAQAGIFCDLAGREQKTYCLLCRALFQVFTSIPPCRRKTKGGAFRRRRDSVANMAAAPGALE